MYIALRLSTNVRRYGWRKVHFHCTDCRYVVIEDRDERFL
jgi:hypothetical protein